MILLDLQIHVLFLYYLEQLKGSSNFALDPLEIILDLAHAAMINL